MFINVGIQEKEVEIDSRPHERILEDAILTRHFCKWVLYYDLLYPHFEAQMSSAGRGPCGRPHPANTEGVIEFLVFPFVCP